MDDRKKSSRLRFEAYRQSLKKRRNPEETGGSSPHASAGPRRNRPRVRSTGQLLREFARLLRPQRGVIVWALGTLTVSTILGLAPPAATKVLVDNVLSAKPLPETIPFVERLPEDRWSLLVVITLAVMLVSFVKAILHVWGRWYATQATKRLQMSIRKRLFEHAVRLPLWRVHELKSGGMASLLREDAGSIGNLVFGLLYNPWRGVVQLLGSLIVLSLVDWRLLLGALAILPAVYFSHRTWIREIRPRFRDVRTRRQSIDSGTTETFAGIRVVRAFSRQRTEALRILSEHHLMGRQELYVWWWMRTIELVWALLIPLASAALMLYGGWQVIEGNLTTGDLMMFLVYLLMLLEPIAILAESAATLQDSLSALDRVLDVLGEEREMPSSARLTKVNREETAGRIVFEDVGFAYRSKEGSEADGESHEGVNGSARGFALREIDLAVEPGQMIALVGPSGAGKTTLCNLVARFYDPTEGRILLDGRDLREIDVESYRGLLGVVEQDVFLFDGTVRENLAYARPDATEEEIVRAARVANADQFIRELADGYDTVIGERGVKLSGGQRQRLAIGRAVLADPRILILDEATSNLDSESERLIQESLQALLRNRTSFVIAHRLSTIRDADLILVLEGGRVVESGTHAELVARGGRYREMAALQTSLAPIDALAAVE